MLFIGMMRDDEVVSVRCRRYAAYSGYAASFKCSGATSGECEQYILSMDACTHAHFSPDHVLRDVRKAYTAFASLPHSGSVPLIVSTGRWGCGVFGGMPAHKMVQQACAAALAGVSLEFSCFGTPDNCDEAADFLSRGRLTVSQTWALLNRRSSRSEFTAAMQLSVCAAVSVESSWGSPAAARAPGPGVLAAIVLAAIVGVFAALAWGL